MKVFEDFYTYRLGKPSVSKDQYQCLNHSQYVVVIACDMLKAMTEYYLGPPVADDVTLGMVY